MNEVYLGDISPKDKPWEKHRFEVGVVEQMYWQTKYPRCAERMQGCSNLLGFAVGTDSDLHLHTARFCRCRHCPICQWRRSMMWRARFLKALPAINEAYPTARYIFLTLTVRNCPIQELRVTIAYMNKAFAKMVKWKLWPADGWIKALEITRGQAGDCHPHFHCILKVPAGYFKGPRYIKQDSWREMWKRALRVDYLPVVHVRSIKGKAPDQDAMISALMETIKYSVKPDDLMDDPQWLEAITEQLHKVRSINLGGCLRKFLSENEPEDLINDGDLDIPDEIKDEFFFHWQPRIGRYVKVDKDKIDKDRIDNLKDKIDASKQDKIDEPRHFKDYDEYEIEDWIRLGNIEEALAMGKDKIIDKIKPGFSPIDKIKGMRAQWNDDATLMAQAFPEHKARSRHFQI